MDKNNSHKYKMLIYFSLVMIGLIIIGSTSYAVWNKVITTTGTNNITTKGFKLEFLESNNQIININNAIPMPDSDGIFQGDKFDFSVLTETDSNTNITYNLVLQKLSVDAGYTALGDNEVKIYLINKDSGEVILAPILVSNLSSNFVIATKTHTHSSSNVRVIDKYELRAWIDEFSENRHNWNGQESLQYKFKINLQANK